MKEITFLHISDLHFQESKQKDIAIVSEALQKDIDRLRKEESIVPDCIFFSGDLVWAADNSNDYDLAWKYFLEPLLTRLGLNKERLFITPGNHDVQISKIDPISEAGLKTILISNESINNFIDNISTNNIHFARMDNFNKFSASMNSGRDHTINTLYSTYKLSCRESTIGVACLNSSWRASGKSENYDHGKLLIGERQVDNAVQDIKDCELKIAILHHPFEWLAPFDLSCTRRRIFTNFDIVLFGHNHDPLSEYVSNTAGQIIISNSGCLFGKREYLNGYVIIKYNLDNGQVTAFLRTYFDERREFTKALNVSEDGKKTFTVNRNARNALCNGDLSVLTKLNETISEFCNKKLLTVTTDSIAPKDIRNIFVEPPISFKTERESEIAFAEEKKDQKEDYLSIKKLISLNENYLIIGKKESGKTTFLNYIALATLESEATAEIKYPFYIDYKELPQGKDIVQKAMREFICNVNLTIDVDSLLRDGKCLILVDNLEFERSKKLERFKDFIRQYPKNRFIFTIEDELLASFKLGDTPDLGLTIKKLYIHPFTRNKTRQLVQKWFMYSPANVDKILDKLLHDLSEIRVPRNPVILSILLWILEKQNDYSPINKAEVVQKFIETLLERLSLDEIRRSSVDYRIKQHYLSHIAYRMNEKDKYYYSLADLEHETMEYFKSKGLKQSVDKFIDYFINKGIFINCDGTLSFKFRCFCEYFLALRLIEDKSFYDQIFKDEIYLSYANEIDFMSGLRRNDEEVLKFLAQKLDELHKEFGLNELGIDLFDTIELSTSILNELNEFITKLRDKMPSEEAKDEILEERYPNIPADGRNMSRLKQRKPIARYFDSLLLFSKVIRNSELIDNRKLKEKCLRDALLYWGKATLFLMLEAEEHIENYAFEGKEHDKDEVRYFILVTLPIAVQLAMQDMLGSEKMEISLEEGIQDSGNSKYLSMLYIFLYSDLRLPSYLDKLNKLLSIVKSNRYLVYVNILTLHIYRICYTFMYDDWGKFEGEVVVRMALFERAFTPRSCRGRSKTDWTRGHFFGESGLRTIACDYYQRPSRTDQ